MTNKKAIEELREIYREIDDVFIFTSDKKIEALDLAIKALEQIEQEVDDVSPCANCQEFDCYGCKVKEKEWKW